MKVMIWSPGSTNIITNFSSLIQSFTDLKDYWVLRPRFFRCKPKKTVTKENLKNSFTCIMYLSDQIIVYLIHFYRIDVVCFYHILTKTPFLITQFRHLLSIKTF